MADNGDRAAFASAAIDPLNEYRQAGLTKREYAAIAIMASSATRGSGSIKGLASDAVAGADALMAELAKSAKSPAGKGE